MCTVVDRVYTYSTVPDCLMFSLHVGLVYIPHSDCIYIAKFHTQLASLPHQIPPTTGRESLVKCWLGGSGIPRMSNNCNLNDIHN